MKKNSLGKRSLWGDEKSPFFMAFFYDKVKNFTNFLNVMLI